MMAHLSVSIEGLHRQKNKKEKWGFGGYTFHRQIHASSTNQIFDPEFKFVVELRDMNLEIKGPWTIITSM